MPRVAFMTFGLLVAEWNDPRVKGFVDRIPNIFEAAESSEGFIDRFQSTHIGSDVAQWGEFVYPGFLTPDQYSRVAQTLSVWEDLESVFAFAYAGFHAEALKHRKEWAEEPSFPNYAAWWVEDDHIPSFSEATARLEHLHAHSATPFVFTFKQPYGPDGAVTAIDHARVKALTCDRTKGTGDRVP